MFFYFIWEKNCAGASLSPRLNAVRNDMACKCCLFFCYKIRENATVCM